MDRSILRITKELGEIQNGDDLTMAIDVQDDNICTVKALVFGPHDTPYEHGFFEFQVNFESEYPSKPPTVTCLTTNYGQCRFSPNIYASGRVCLSILGTWRGEPGEQWSPAQGLESVLLSIQSLMSPNPFENEPGYAATASDTEKDLAKHYVHKIRHETIRISVIQRLELDMEVSGRIKKRRRSSEDFGSPSHPESGQEKNTRVQGHQEDEQEVIVPFSDLIKSRFLWYFETYMSTVKVGKASEREGTTFRMMPFEGADGGHGMRGMFNYTELESRLIELKKSLEAETLQWEKQGIVARDEETAVAVNLQNQFDNIVANFKKNYLPHSLSQADKNPFVWELTYIGQPMTRLDGGLFRVKINISPKFPDDQPRIHLQTPLFHLQVANDGTACYAIKVSDRGDMSAHIQALLSVFENDEPAFDPRLAVNTEAAKLYWSSDAADRKMYHRRLRRCAQSSVE